VQGAFARTGFALILLSPPVRSLRLGLAGEHGHQRIGTQLVMIVEIIVPNTGP
jgi:hypothetical protein